MSSSLPVTTRHNKFIKFMEECKVKKILATVTVLALILAMLAGCGSSDNPGSGGDNNTANPGNTNSGSNSTATTTIEFFNMKNEIVSILQTLIAEYENDHPDVHIELVTPADGMTVLASRMANNDTPDIFTNWPNASFYVQVDSGYVMDLSGTGIMDNVQDAARAQWKHNGGEYAATVSYNCSGIWYNMEMLSNVGVTELPATWDELTALCDKLSEAGITPFVTGAKDTELTDRHLQVFLASYMGDEYDAFETAASNHTMDASASYNDALKYMAEKMVYVISQSQSDVVGTDQDSATANFANGEGAMMIGGSWLLASVSAANPNMNIKMGPLPADNAADTNTCAFPGDMTLCVAANSDVQDAAVEFVKWFTSKEIATKYAEMEGNPSCIKDVTYVADAFSDLYADYVTTGKFILNPDCTWGGAAMNAAGAVVQELYYYKDVDSFPTSLCDAFNTND